MCIKKFIPLFEFPEMEGRFKRMGIYVYLWLISLRFDKKLKNSIKQLSFKKKKHIYMKTGSYGIANISDK